MERFKTSILSKQTVDMYDYDTIKGKIYLFFKKYKDFILKRNLIAVSLSDPLAEDNLGIFNSEYSNPIHNKVEQMEKISKYIEAIERYIDILKKEMTDDEVLIFDNSIILELSDEEVASQLCISTRELYQRKKSCFIKTAIFFNLEKLKKGSTI